MRVDLCEATLIELWDILSDKYRLQNEHSVWYHYVTTDPHTEQCISKSKYGFGGGDFKGTSVVPIMLELFYDQGIWINSVIRSKYLFTAGVAEVIKVPYAKYNLS